MTKLFWTLLAVLTLSSPVAIAQKATVATSIVDVPEFTVNFQSGSDELDVEGYKSVAQVEDYVTSNNGGNMPVRRITVGCEERVAD